MQRSELVVGAWIPEVEGKLAGLGLNLYQSDPIYKNMIRESKYPGNLFEGSPETLAALRQRIAESLGGRPQF